MDAVFFVVKIFHIFRVALMYLMGRSTDICLGPPFIITLVQYDVTLGHVLTLLLDRTVCTSVALYISIEDVPTDKTGYPGGFNCFPKFRREKSGTVPQLGQDSLIRNSYQFFIISQPHPSMSFSLTNYCAAWKNREGSRTDERKDEKGNISINTVC